MNNPYRARPGRLRVDHTATPATKYAPQNQNSWPSMPTPNAQPSANVYQQQQPQSVNQANKAGDPWDWSTDNNVDNGNDAWNWSIDQAAESNQAQQAAHQQQQPPQQQQQQHFVPTYPNLRPTHQNLVQDNNYYSNVNGNNRPIQAQHQLSGANTPRNASSRESTSSQPDSYNQFTNFNHGQQPPRTNSTKSSSSVNDNQNSHQHFNPYFPPAASTPFDLNNQSTHPQQYTANNYNWNGVDQGNVAAQNWQNQVPDATPYWQEQGQGKKEEVGTVDNQWAQVQQQQVHQPQQQQHLQPQQQQHHQPQQQQQHHQPQQLHHQQQQVHQPQSLPTPNLPQTQSEAPPQSWHGNYLEPNQMRRQSQDAISSNQWHEESHENRIPSEQRNQQNNYLPSDNTNSNVNQSWQSWQNVPHHQGSSNAMWQEKNAEADHKLTDISLESSVDESQQQKEWQSPDHQQMNYPATESVNKVEDCRLDDNKLFSMSDSHAGKSKGGPLTELALSNILGPQSTDNRLNADQLNAAKATELNWSADRDGNSLTDLTVSVNQLNLSDKSPKLYDANSIQSMSSPFPAPSVMDPRSQIAPQSAAIRYQENSSVASNHPLPHAPPPTSAHEPVAERTSLAQIGVQPGLHQPEHSAPPNASYNPATAHSQEFPSSTSIEQTHSLTPQTEFIDKNPPVRQQPQQQYANAGLDSHISLETVSKPNQEPIPPTSTSENPPTNEPISSSSYDTWYNQSSMRTPPVSAQRNWYPNAERNVPQQQTWTPEIPQNYKATEACGTNTNETVNSQALEINDKKSVAGESVVADSTSPKDTYQQIADVHPENYEFASNDRNTFLETGELTDSHHDQESNPTLQEDESDEVPSDIPFIREVPGQSSSIDPRRMPAGQEQYVQPQSSPRLVDTRRADLPGQIVESRRMSLERSERRDMPPGQERPDNELIQDNDAILERRNDPSGREQSLPPSSQSRNDPSGQERSQNQSQIILEPSEIREIPGGMLNPDDPAAAGDGIRQITGRVSSLEPVMTSDNNTRVVPGSQETLGSGKPDLTNETRSKREEAVGASIRENVGLVSNSPKRRDSLYEDGDDEESGNSRDDNRERRRDQSPSDRRRYDYDRKGDRYYDRDRKYDDDDYYYESRRYDRAYNSRENPDRRDQSFREGERRHASRDDLDDRRRLKDDDERDGRRRNDGGGGGGGVGDRPGRDPWDDPRRRDGRDYDPRYPREPNLDRNRRRDGRRRWYDEYDPRDPRRDYYDDPFNKNSRPSSRSSYNDRDRDYYMRPNLSRDPYYGYNADVYGAYDYGNNYNANYYAYLENLRRTNPTAYMEWYNKYYGGQQQQHTVARGVSTTYPEDRASVHSGRSSCEDRTTSGKQTIGDMSLLEDARAVSRLTPTKFSTAHVRASFTVGSLVHVHACYPADGERAKVDVMRLDSLLMHDPVARELRAYPGPLLKGVTHKKPIIDYCEAKIKKAIAYDDLVDPASYILLYQLMIMLIQQNGNVVGVDIATLLLRNKETYPYESNKHQNSHQQQRRESVISQRSSGAGREPEDSPPIEENSSKQSPKTVDQVTDEFRNTLLYGLVQEALEYAMNEGLWGHALFLASKLDKRTHASVMTRFANSLPVQDPLQTLYQLHSGRVPASVTCVSDPKWDDWRPHLAMIISNTSANPEINRRAITTLGDTLAARGDIYAAHFCYILAQIEFGNYGVSGVKLVLIGANHHKSYAEFATPEAVMLTEIYEYARNLSESGFTLISLQKFKLETAQKMVDYGLTEKALLYLEQIAVNIVKEPTKYKQSFINDVYTLSERIKYHDPVYKDSVEDKTTLAWLYNLGEIADQIQAGEIVRDTNDAPALDNQSCSAETNSRNEQQQQISQQQQQWTQYRSGQDYGAVSMMDVPVNEQPQDQWQPMSLPQATATINDAAASGYSAEQNTYGQSIDVNQYHHHQQQQQNGQAQQQQDYWGQQVYNQQDYARDYATGDQWQQQQGNSGIYQQDQNDVDSSVQQSGGWNYEPQPQISMGPSSGKQYDPLEELDALESPGESMKSTADAKKSQDKSSDKKTTNSGGSWFGGLFSKLTPKPKNQMILPDDNNPTIVWDPVAKKWTNKDEDADSSSSRLAPPPKMAEMNLNPPASVSPLVAPVTEQIQSLQDANRPPSADSTTPNSSKMISGSNNMFKLQKGRSMRANYIDVMNPSGTKSNGAAPSLAPTPATSPIIAPMAASSPQLFVPAPVNDPNAPVDFLTPTPAPTNPVESAPQGLSRWSSASSLSREVQSYTMRDPRLHQRNKGPMMYNPSEVKDNTVKNMPRSRYPPR